MEAVKDPDSRRDQTIEKLILQYQTPLLRLSVRRDNHEREI